MANLKFFIDADKVASQFGDLKAEVEQAIEQGVRALSSMTHAKTVELASSELNSTRSLYLKNLTYQEIQPGLWVVALDNPALWIEEGRKAGSMVDDLLRTGAKTSKDGNRYKAIPFEHSKPSSQNSSAAQQFVNILKGELRKRGVPFKGIEKDRNGSPRIGKIHTINMPSTPYPSSRANTPVFMGVNIYQTKTAAGSVRRDIMTFRIVSDKHKAEGKWVHPGREPSKFMDQALDWAVKHWEQEVMPEILGRFE